MRKEWCQAGAQILAFAILVSLAADLLLKDRDNLEEVLWSCYWGALAVSLGVISRSNLLVSSGLVFFAGLGAPAWVVGRFMETQIDPTSVLIHFLPLGAGVLYLARMAALPRHTVAAAWSLHAMPLGLAWLFSTPGANINFAHASWPPLARFLPYLWEFHLLVLAASAATLTLAARSINRILVSRAESRPMAKQPARAA